MGELTPRVGLEERQNKPLDELVKKVYVGRNEKKLKAKAKVMVAFLQPQRNNPQGPRIPQDRRNGIGHKDVAETFPPCQGRAGQHSSWEGICCRTGGSA